MLLEAEALWRGRPYADVELKTFAQDEIRRLKDLRLDAIETRIEAELGLERHAELAGELKSLTAAHPTREHFTAQLMIALYRCGRQAEALDAYRRLRGRGHRLRAGTGARAAAAADPDPQPRRALAARGAGAAAGRAGHA